MKALKIIAKILLMVTGGILTLALTACIVFLAVFRHEISSVASIEMLIDKNEKNRSAPVYYMEVSGGYYFDDFLEQGGASSDDELIKFVTDKLTKGLLPITIEPSRFGCSAFTCTGEDGDKYFARNYDFTTTPGMIVRTNPGKGRYASISSVDLKFIGLKDGVNLDDITQKLICLAAPYVPVDGINEAGVACGILVSYQGAGNECISTNQQTDKPDITSSTMIRMILDYAGSVEEAVALVEKYDLHDSANSSFHYIVADSTGKSAILEWVYATDETDTDGTKRELKVIYNDDDAALGEAEAADKFQYVTNFIACPGYYLEGDDVKSLDRYTTIRKRINGSGKNTEGIISEENALKLMRRVGGRIWYGENSAITVWSALYNLTDKSVIWVSNEEFDNEDAVFRFDFE